MYTLEHGTLAVKIAREVVEKHVRNEERPKFSVPEIFNEKSGVFVTLDTYPERELRGCIGFPEPIYPLIEAIINAAQSAATDDPRFPPVKPDELDNIVIEVSILTPPQLIRVKKPKEYPEHVRIGTDGLIVAKGYHRGLLLPQVATEYKWNAEEFLAQTCWKAGIPPDSWLDPTTKIFKFQAEIFAEETPRGKIIPKKLID